MISARSVFDKWLSYKHLTKFDDRKGRPKMGPNT
jgi:hypothetical protein